MGKSPNTLGPRGITDANYPTHMNVALQSRVRRIFSREFYRRGRLTWDMKMELRRLAALL
jgi:hypothetical protein